MHVRMPNTPDIAVRICIFQPTQTGLELFILFAASAFRKLSSIYVFSCFPFGFGGGMWDLVVSVPDHCLSFYFTSLLRYAYTYPYTYDISTSLIAGINKFTDDGILSAHNLVIEREGYQDIPKEQSRY